MGSETSESVDIRHFLLRRVRDEKDADRRNRVLQESAKALQRAVVAQMRAWTIDKYFCDTCAKRSKEWPKDRRTKLNRYGSLDKRGFHMSFFCSDRCEDRYYANAEWRERLIGLREFIEEQTEAAFEALVRQRYAEYRAEGTTIREMHVMLAACRKLLRDRSKEKEITHHVRRDRNHDWRDAIKT